MYSLKIERKAAYLQATATGILNAETGKQIDEELVQICQDEGYRGAMVRFFTGIRAASAWLRQEGSQSLQTKGVDSDEE